MKDNTKGCLIASLALPTTFFGVIWLGYVMVELWNWHVSGWNGLLNVSYKMMIAIDYIVLLALGTRGTKMEFESEDKQNRHIVSILVITFLMPAIALLVGWLLK